MRKNATDGDMNSIYSGVFGPLRHLNAFVERVSLLLPRIEGIAKINGVQLGLQVIIGAHLFADGLNDFEQKRCAVAKCAAIFVFAVVDGGTQELGNQIAMGGMQFDAI